MKKVILIIVLILGNINYIASTELYLSRLIRILRAFFIGSEKLNRRLFEAISKNEDISYLLRSGADPNAIHRNFYHYYTPLYLAAKYNNLDAAKKLIKAGADTDVKTDQGSSPLSIAVKNDKLEMVKLLLDSNADIDIQDFFKERPLYIAAKNNKLDIFKILLEKDDNLNSRNISGRTTLYIAVKNNNLEMVELLLKRRANPDIPNYVGKTPLHIAVRRGYIDIIKALLSRNANPNNLDFMNLSPKDISIYNCSKNSEIYEMLSDPSMTKNVKYREDISKMLNI